MADEKPAVQNKGMLIVALVLGVLVVLVYNWQITQVRDEAKGETVYLLRVAVDYKQGTALDARRLEVNEVAAHHAKGLGPVVVLRRPEEKNNFNGYTINRSMRAGETLLWSHIQHQADPPPSSLITPGMVAKAIRLQKAPGDILRPGDLVNLLGRFPVNGVVQPYRIIEGVKVVGVGGKTINESPLSDSYARRDEGLTSYREITIELSREASLQMEAILAHASLGLEIEVLPHSAIVPDAGKVYPDLLRALPGIPVTQRD